MIRSRTTPMVFPPAAAGYGFPVTSTPRTPRRRVSPEAAAAQARTWGGRHFVVPRHAGVPLAEAFLVSAVATVLIIRFYLWATGYPQVGGDGLHVAHVLWGGLLMMAGALVMFLRLGLPAMRLGSVLVGVGFGFFVDEIGKFVTSDVNYFFQPAIAMIYVIFVVLAMVLAVARRRMRLDPRTALANALALADVAMHDPSAGDQRREVLFLLDHSDPDDPLVTVLRERVQAADAEGGERASRWQRWRMGAADRYAAMAGRPAFTRVLVGVFAFIAVVTLASAAVLAAAADRLGVADWLQVAGSVAAAVLIVVGFTRYRHSRLHAYQWFERALLVNLLITSVFSFYNSPGYAVIGVFVNVVLLVGVRFAITREAHVPQPDVT